MKLLSLQSKDNSLDNIKTNIIIFRFAFLIFANYKWQIYSSIWITVPAIFIEEINDLQKPIPLLWSAITCTLKKVGTPLGLVARW